MYKFYLGGSKEYPESMFKSKNKKLMYTPVNPSFTILKWGVRGSSFHRHVIMMIEICLAQYLYFESFHWSWRNSFFNTF